MFRSVWNFSLLLFRQLLSTSLLPRPQTIINIHPVPSGSDTVALVSRNGSISLLLHRFQINSQSNKLNNVLINYLMSLPTGDIHRVAEGGEELEQRTLEKKTFR